jgi:hypothetical protein
MVEGTPFIISFLVFLSIIIICLCILGFRELKNYQSLKKTLSKPQHDDCYYVTTISIFLPGLGIYYPYDFDKNKVFVVPGKGGSEAVKCLAEVKNLTCVRSDDGKNFDFLNIIQGEEVFKAPNSSFSTVIFVIKGKNDESS